MTVVVKDYYLPQRGNGGRYPDSTWAYEEFPDITWENLSTYATSENVLDLVAAHVFMRTATLALPLMWLVIEDPETSPNLNRDGTASRTLDYQIRSPWAACYTEDEAIAWCTMFQEKSDKLVERNRWGEKSRRIFKVVHAAGASVHCLRQPGAEPWTGAFE